MSNLVERIFEIYKEHTANAGNELKEVTMETLIDLDSIQKLMFFSALESELNVIFEFNDFEKINTIEDVTKVVCNNLKK